MFDLKAMRGALDQLENDRGIPKEKIIEAIEDALAAAYKKDYGKKGQVVKGHFDLETGATSFYQIKTVVDESMVRMEEDDEEEIVEETPVKKKENEETPEGEDEEEVLPRFNPEQHILLEDARIIKKDTALGDEMIFTLEAKDDYGRIAAQTAKQVIMQRIREAERVSVLDQYENRIGEIVSGTVQRVERGNVYVELGRITGVIYRNEQIPGEYYKTGDRIRAYLYAIDDGGREITLKLSRSHPQFLDKLFEIEVPEIANKVVEIKAIAREPGSRSKIAVVSHDEHIDPVGSCVGQRGVRVATIMNELGGERIDVIEWDENIDTFIDRSLSPGEVASVTRNEENHSAIVEVAPDQYSLAIGKGGQNVRLAAKLTGWKIDIQEIGGGKGNPLPPTEPTTDNTQPTTDDGQGDETATKEASDDDTTEKNDEIPAHESLEEIREKTLDEEVAEETATDIEGAPEEDSYDEEK